MEDAVHLVFVLLVFKVYEIKTHKLYQPIYLYVGLCIFICVYGSEDLNEVKLRINYCLERLESVSDMMGNYEKLNHTEVRVEFSISFAPVC